MTEQSLDLTDPRMLQRTAEHLSTRCAGTFFPELVERCVAECHADLSRSAGIQPAAAMDPYAEGVLVGHGDPAATAPPKPVTGDLLRAADWVIALGDLDLGPPRPGAAHQMWPVRTNPEASQWPGVVADLEARVTALQVEITALPAGPTDAG